jgi:hypothetical protein
MKKSALTLLMVGIFITFSLTTAHSDDFNIWKGKWFKVTNKGSGYYTDASGKLIAQKNTLINYLQVWDVKETEKTLLVDWYDDVGNYYGEYNFYILGDNSLDFLCRLEISETFDSSSDFIGMAFRIQGKLKGAALASATFKSVGGFSWGAIEMEQEGYIKYSAANLIWSGNMIAESKVPF